MLSLNAQNDLFGLYIHWPFCLSKCPYCDFNSHVREQVDQAKFKAALLRELEYYAQLTNHLPVSSIFFGGGTPSLMPVDTVAAIIDTAQKNWHFKNDIEITLEANPTSTEVQKFRDFRTAGINRVSLGVQSLRDDELKKLGREHSAAQAIKAIETSQNVFDRSSFDLIYAREGQTLKAWEAELCEGLQYADAHMSLYQLTIEPGTAFHTQFQRGDLTIPDDEAAAKFFELTQSIMGDAGLPAYEVSNHAKPGEESRHNLIYWHYGQYAGIGPGAHGRINIDGQRHATRAHRAPESWADRVLDKGQGAHPFEALNKTEQAQEALMMGLRLTNGIDKTLFQKQTGCELSSVLAVTRVEHLKVQGYLKENDNYLLATQKGLLCLNTLLGHIIA